MRGHDMDRPEISPPPPLKRRKISTGADIVGKEKPPAITTAATSASSSSSSSSFRIFSWNVNGIQPFLPSSSALITSYFKPTAPSTSRERVPDCSLRAFLSRHNWPEVLFLQELKISPNDTKTVTALQSAVNGSDAPSPTTSYIVDVCLPRDKYNAKAFGGKLYGVATIIRTDFAKAHVVPVREVDWDTEGRVLIVETKKLALVNLYAVNGTTAPYFDPKTGKETGTRHDRKIQFHTLFRDECIGLQKRGLQVVVAGDLNIARGRLDGHPNLRTWPAQHCVNRGDFNRKFFGEEENKRAEGYVSTKKEEEKVECLDAVDVFRAIHGKERKYTYHPRTKQWGSSCDRVDMVFVSRSLFDDGNVLRTGILDTPLERGSSDHVPLWVEIEV